MELREFMKRYRLPLIAGAGALALGLAAYALAASHSVGEAPLPPTSLQAEPSGTVPKSMNDVQITFAPVVRKVAPAVVNVYARTVVRESVNPFFNDPFFQQFFGNPGERQRVQQSLGSGVIVRADGLILTNNHVVQGGQDIVVALSDKREFKARVVLADPRTDLAVLRIEVKGERLPTVEFGNSDRVQVGDLVLAIGDPFGVGQTVTMGIVSALARTEVSASNYQFFIQTDAAINPGNSGGALVDANGRLVGINTAIFSRSGGNIGIGFAIPANLARRVAEGAVSGGVKLPWAGVDGQPVTGDIAASLGLKKPGGVLLKSVYPGGPASDAGLRVGDVILMVDGAEVDDMQSLNYRVATHKQGERIAARVVSDGKVRDVGLTLALPPEDPPRSAITIGGRSPLTGAKVENLSPAVANELQMDLMAKGVVVAAVAPGAIAGSYGFQPGDIVRQINGNDIASTAELKSWLDGAQGWLIVVDRGGQRMTLRVGR
jgi:Do/DeqQ family serine protease